MLSNSAAFTVFDSACTDFARIMALIRQRNRSENLEADIFDYNGKTLVIVYPTLEQAEDFTAESAYKGS